jgi:homopolymeric O-antigen transport system permease protein
VKVSESTDKTERRSLVTEPPPGGISRDEIEHPAQTQSPWTSIESEEKGVSLNLREFWAQRELLYFLTLRDLKVRYKQTFMGVVWVVIQPLFLMLVVTLIFRRIVISGDSSGMPYSLFAYAGLLLWTFFSNAILNSVNSLINNANLVTKVYFPRMYIPVAAVGAGLVDLAIASVILAGLLFYYRLPLTWSFLFLPLYVIQVLLLALGVGLLISAVTVKYRDLRYALPFVVQFWMFATPVIYPSSILPESWRWVFALNPMTGIIEGFRSAIAGIPLNLSHFAISWGVTLGVLVLGVYVFRKIEDTFADLI